MDRGLRKDDSLFTPGSVVWSKAVVDDLQARFVEHLDESNLDFVEKFRDQISGAPPGHHDWWAVKDSNLGPAD
jgi:hypothetical protein